MKVAIAGIGMGNPALLTAQARKAIDASGLLVGARRLLDSFPESDAVKIQAALPEKIAEALREYDGRVERAAVLVSGDTGFYSAAKTLPALLPGMETQFFCGISSLQYFSARLGTSWDDARVVSLHGREQDLLGAVYASKKTFVLTGGGHSARNICAMLAESGLGHLRVAVGEDLSYAGEQVTTGDAQQLSQRDFSPLSVMMIDNPAPREFPASHGMADTCFIRGEVPMTKAEVRAVSLAKLELRHGQTLWDVGAGTGSVSVEAARVLRDGAVYAVEHDGEALELLRQNRERFLCRNLYIAAGKAPEALGPLPAPDAVFVGGSSGGLRQIIAAALEKNPKARIVVNAITLETVTAALDAFAEFSLPDRDLAQIAVTKLRHAGSVHMMTGQNPVFVMSAGGQHES